MKPTTERLVDDYLKQLDSELADLPRLRRKEIVEEISEHIAEARAASPSQGEAEIRTLLDRLGDPAEIASEAKERFGVQPRKSRALEIATLLLLLVGGVVLPVIGWLIGVVLLWVSDAWDSRDKLIGTLVVPGGLLLPLALLTIGDLSRRRLQHSGTGGWCKGSGCVHRWLGRDQRPEPDRGDGPSPRAPGDHRLPRPADEKTYSHRSRI